MEELMARDNWDYVEKTKELIEASQDGFDELVKALGNKIKLHDLADEKVQAAIKAKKMAMMDARDILKLMQELEKSIGVKSKGVNIEDKKEWEGSIVEKKFKK